MIYFFDFPPQIIEPRGLMSYERCESLRDVMVRVNQWVEQNRIKVLNVETLVLPSGVFQDPVVVADATSIATPDGYATWRQIVRVWYEK
jgi:hypothetical protein